MPRNALGRDPFEILSQSLDESENSKSQKVAQRKNSSKDRKEQAIREDKSEFSIFEAMLDERLKSATQEIQNKLQDFENSPIFVSFKTTLERLQKTLDESSELAEQEKGIFSLEKKKPTEKLFKLLELLSGYLPAKILFSELLNFFVFTSYDDVDEFGYSEKFAAKVEPFFRFFYKGWFRVDIEGLENIPEKGGVILVSNHAGMLPWDAAMLAYGFKHNPPKRPIRPLVEDVFFYLPFLGTVISRLGGVRANYENALRLLKKGEIVAVFPEGIKGLGKSYKERYKLQRFARGGVARLHFETGVPIVPVGIVGSEETHPIIFSSEYLAERLNLAFFPITLTFPWLGILGLLPLPSKWYITIGRPINFAEGTRKSSKLDDEILISKVTNKIREVVHELLYETIKKRKSAFLG